MRYKRILGITGFISTCKSLN